MFASLLCLILIERLLIGLLIDMLIGLLLDMGNKFK